MTKFKALDPLKVRERTYRQFARLLDMLEDPKNEAEVTIPQLIAALKALDAYDTKRHPDDPDADTAGSAVRKFSAAFASNGAGRRAKGPARLAAVDTDAGPGTE
jgi:hypothetical protein